MTTVPQRVPQATPETPRCVTFGSREFMTAALLVACAPLVLLVPNQDWFFTPETTLDPWHYVGLFHEYLNPDHAPGAYKLARLPWILSGFLVNRLLDPIPAAYALHALFLCLTPLALFVALYAQLRRLALAGVVATAFGFYTHAHGSGSWDYHNTAAGAFYLLTVMMLALPAVVEGRRLPLMVAGATTALAVHTNITLLNFLPVLGFCYVKTVQLRTGEWPPVRALVMRAAWILLGGLLVTTLLGLVNWMAGREFLFFGFLVTLVVQYVADPNRYQSGYHQAWSIDWVLRARYLALPAAVFFVGIAYLVLARRSRRHRIDPLAPSLAGTFIVMVLLWIGWQTVGQTALDWNYFAYPLTPPCFIALAGLLSRGWPDACERHWLATLAGTIVVCAIALTGALEPYMTHATALAAEPVLTIVGCISFAAALVAYFARPGITMSIVVITVFAFDNRLVAYGPLDYAASDPCKNRAAIYAAVVDGASWLGALDPTYKRIRTWFDQDERINVGSGCEVGLGNVGYAITSTAFIPYVTTPFPMPGVDAVPATALDALANNQFILAIVTNKSEHLDSWDRRLRALGLEPREVARHEVAILASRFTMRAWAPRRLGSPEQASFSPPVITISDQTPRKVNLYGVTKGDVVDRGGRVVVTPSDPRDHVEYGLLDLPSSTSAVWARVTIESPADNAASCQVEIKDPSFAVLVSLECRSAVRYVTLPMGMSALRVYVSDFNSRPFTLPTKIEIALAEPSK